jgi:hypothetical protein
MKTKPNEGIVHANMVKDSTRPPVDFTKEWTNGHKFFTSQQSQAFVELLHREEGTRVRHDHYKKELTRPRNPLNGDPTPRDIHGEVVMNPKWLYTVKQNAIPLFPENHNDELSRSIVNKFITKDPVGKIGVYEEKYDVLGNNGKRGTPAVAEDLNQTIAKFHQTKQEKIIEREKINEYVAREKALRHQKELARQLKILHRQMDEKQKEMTFIQTQYQL